MEQQDELKAILKNIEIIHPEVDLEQMIMGKIENQSAVKKQIAKNKTYGLVGIIFSIVLSVVFGIFFRNPDIAFEFKNLLLQLGICTFVLLLLFMQLETASRVFTTKQKTETQPS